MLTILQVSRHLFKWTKEVSYADYYERALTNGVLSIQRGTEDRGDNRLESVIIPEAQRAKAYLQFTNNINWISIPTSELL